MELSKDIRDWEMPGSEIKALNGTGKFLLQMLVDATERLKKPIRSYWFESQEYRRDLHGDLLRILYASTQMASKADHEFPMAELLDWPEDLIPQVLSKQDLQSLRTQSLRLCDSARSVVYPCLLRPEWLSLADDDKRNRHENLQDGINKAFDCFARQVKALVKKFESLTTKK